MPAVALICMPWHVVRAPSIQLGILQAVLDARGISCSSHSLHLEFAAFVRRCEPGARPLFSLEEYFALGEAWFFAGAGDYAFAVPGVRAPDPAADRAMLAHLGRERVPANVRRRLVRLRERVPAFLAMAAEEILADGPAIVGFTTTFGQLLPALALAAELKARRPGLCVVFGGAACSGEPGEAIVRTFPQVDVVVRGEGEEVFPALVAARLAGEPVPELAGLCFRRGGVPVVVPEAHGAFVDLDASPAPDYREYFVRLERLGLDADVAPVLPVETSRGCWWGAVSHCTFCGMNGEAMTYRSKAPALVVDELVDLARAHRVLDVTVVDNILDPRYFRTVLPRLRELRSGIRLFWQAKANVTREQVELLHAAGVHCIRPGIESLSTSMLQRMKKGVSALQNVRLLKWCAEQGLHVAWNLIHGLPGAVAADYAAMADLAGKLVHLAPPALVPLTLDRFSPLHDDAARHGLRVLGAPPQWRLLLGVDAATAQQLAWTFAYESEAPSPEVRRELTRLEAAVAAWRNDRAANVGALTYRAGPGFVEVTDRRTGFGPRRLLLEGLEAEVFLACEAGASPAAAAATAVRSGQEAPLDAVVATLRTLVNEGLAIEENGAYLVLCTRAP